MKICQLSYLWNASEVVFVLPPRNCEQWHVNLMINCWAVCCGLVIKDYTPHLLKAQLKDYGSGEGAGCRPKRETATKELTRTSIEEQESTARTSTKWKDYLFRIIPPSIPFFEALKQYRSSLRSLIALEATGRRIFNLFPRDSVDLRRAFLEEGAAEEDYNLQRSDKSVEQGAIKIEVYFCFSLSLRRRWWWLGVLGGTAKRPPTAPPPPQQRIKRTIITDQTAAAGCRDRQSQ